MWWILLIILCVPWWTIIFIWYRSEQKASSSQKNDSNPSLLQSPNTKIDYTLYHPEFLNAKINKLHSDTLDSIENRLDKKQIDQTALLIYCETLIKKKYFYLPNPVTLEIENAIPFYIRENARKLCHRIENLSEKEEKKLYSLDSSRWKHPFDELCRQLPHSDVEHFYHKICNLASLNCHVTIIRNIYFKAHQLTSAKNARLSARLYLHYLSVKSESPTFQYKQIAQKDKKIIFSTPEQQKTFETLTKTFLKRRNLEKALSATDELFTPQRRKIKLDSNVITKAKEKHTRVVHLLNDYLADEEPEELILSAEEDFTKKNGLDNIQKSFIDLLLSKEYNLDNESVNRFAESNGIFKSRLIDGINELFYEELDDLLIEEDENGIILNKIYLKQLNINFL